MSDWPGVPPGFGTTLPAGPVHQQEFYWLVDGAVNGTIWHMIFEGVTLNKWLFLGGIAMYANIEAVGTRATASYGDMTSGDTTVGPSLTAPAAGAYSITFGSTVLESVASQTGWISPDVAGAGATDADGIFISNNANTANLQVASARTLSAKTIGAPLTVVLKYKPSTAAAMTCQKRWLQLLPVRIDPT